MISFRTGKSQKQLFPSDSIRVEIIWTWLLWEGIYICKRKILSEMIKVGNNSFHQTQFCPKASETISQQVLSHYFRHFWSLSVVCSQIVHILIIMLWKAENQQFRTKSLLDDCGDVFFFETELDPNRTYQNSRRRLSDKWYQDQVSLGAKRDSRQEVSSIALNSHKLSYD